MWYNSKFPAAYYSRRYRSFSRIHRSPAHSTRRSAPQNQEYEKTALHSPPPNPRRPNSSAQTPPSQTWIGKTDPTEAPMLPFPCCRRPETVPWQKDSVAASQTDAYNCSAGTSVPEMWDYWPAPRPDSHRYESHPSLPPE